MYTQRFALSAQEFYGLWQMHIDIMKYIDHYSVIQNELTTIKKNCFTYTTFSSALNLYWLLIDYHYCSFDFSRISYNWSHTIFIIFRCLFCLSKMHLRFIHIYEHLRLGSSFVFVSIIFCHVHVYLIWWHMLSIIKEHLGSFNCGWLWIKLLWYSCTNLSKVSN